MIASDRSLVILSGNGVSSSSAMAVRCLAMMRAVLAMWLASALMGTVMPLMALMLVCFP